jgi:signal transduction histidine kinase
MLTSHTELERLRHENIRLRHQVELLRERELTAQHLAGELRKSNEALRRGIERLASEHDMGAFLSHILQEAVALREDASAQVFLYDPEDHTLAPSLGVDRLGRALATPGLMADLPISGKFPADITGAWSKLLASGTPLLFDIERDGADFWPGTVQWHRSLGHQVVICRALVLDGRPLGMLGMAVKQQSIFSSAELESFEMLAQQAALAIEITRLAEEAHQVAILEERNRIAREIHDTLAQALTGIALQQAAIEGLLEGHSGEPWDALSFHVARTRELARHGLIEARRSVSALRPQALETDDLCTALRKMVVQRCAALAHRFTVQGRPFRMPLEIEQHLLRITQEALTNVLRHARSQHLQVDLSFCPRRVRLCVRDDGRGFVPELEVHGFGLQGMRERAERIGAQLFIDSRPGHGTRIFVTVPVGRR